MECWKDDPSPPLCAGRDCVISKMEGLNGWNRQSSSKALECGHLRLGVVSLSLEKQFFHDLEASSLFLISDALPI